MKRAYPFVNTIKGKLKLFSLPQYALQLHPDELVLNYLKNSRRGRMSHDDKNEFQGRVSILMQSLHDLTNKVTRFFFQPIFKYTGMSGELCVHQYP